jgi:hypothetical protein
MSATRRPAAPDTDWLIDMLTTADAAALVRIADAALSWFAIVDCQFRQRYPMQYAAWRATVTADGLAAADDDDPAPPVWPRH